MNEGHERLTIYTLAWNGDAPVEPGGDTEATSHLHCRAFLNDREIVSTLSATLRYRGGDFATVMLELSPGSVKVVECDEAEWEALSSSGASA